MSDIILGLCPTCQELRYRSKREFEPGERGNPQDFEPVGDTPAPSSDVPMCHMCSSLLVFRPQRQLERSKNTPTTKLRSIAPEVVVLDTLPTVVPSRTATTLFEVEPDEKMVDVKPSSPDTLLVITDRRIVSVYVG